MNFVNARVRVVTEARRLDKLAEENAGAPSGDVYRVGAIVLRAVALAVHPQLDIKDTYFGVLDAPEEMPVKERE